jgi:hypothetical protein
MTPERASDIVYNCPAPYSYDLFEHFIEYYNVTDPKQIASFAMLCGFSIAEDCVMDEPWRGE